MKVINRFGGAFCFIAGLALMGADGDWFPYINVIGAVVLCGCVYFSWKIEEE